MGRFTALVGPFRQYPDSVARLVGSHEFGPADDIGAAAKIPADWRWLMTYWSAFDEELPQSEERFAAALTEATNPSDRACLLVNLMIDGHFNPPRDRADIYRHEVVQYFDNLTGVDGRLVWNKRDLAIVHLNALELLCQVFCYRMDEEMHSKLMRIYYQIAFCGSLVPSLRTYAVEGFYHALRLSVRLIRRRAWEWRYIGDAALEEIRRCHEANKDALPSGEPDLFEVVWTLIGGKTLGARSGIGAPPKRGSLSQVSTNA